MVSNRAFADFRVLSVPGARVKTDALYLSEEEADVLQVGSGDMVRLTSLKTTAQIRL